MPAKSLEPLKKITVDLFLADVVWLQANSDNLSEEIRTALRNHIVMMKAAKQRMTLGDLNAR